jgi:hypothetical protein
MNRGRNAANQARRTQLDVEVHKGIGLELLLCLLNTQVPQRIPANSLSFDNSIQYYFDNDTNASTMCVAQSNRLYTTS